MAKIFISHSSKNNPEAKAFVEWLVAKGWDDYFFDIDRAQGISPGERWEAALRAAADRCEAVIFLISEEWLGSTWCIDEFRLTRLLGKRKLFGVIVKPVDRAKIPSELTRVWQLCDLKEPGETEQVKTELKGNNHSFEFSCTGLDRLKIGLRKAGLSPESFDFDVSRSPYPGLAALDVDDAAIFFGRDAQIVRALDELRTLRATAARQIYAILGASGAGKSSFLRAGILARLKRDDRNFLVLPAIRPLDVAITGEDGMAKAFHSTCLSLGLSSELGNVKTKLDTDTGFEELVGAIRNRSQQRIAVADPGAKAPMLVIPVDQAEELLAPSGGVEAKRALEILGRLSAMRGSVMAITTIRADHFGQLQRALAHSAVEIATLPLGPIETAYYGQLVDGPAQRRTMAGKPLSVSPDLREALIGDIKGQGDILPLLAFTMNRLYSEYGSDGKLELHEYDAMGKIGGAINRAAQDAMRNPDHPPTIATSEEEQDSVLRDLFISRLVRFDGGVPLRQPASLDDLQVGEAAYIERLTNVRLLTRDRRGDKDVVEISHEAVLRNWTKLDRWIRENADDLRIREGLERAAAEWVSHGREEAYLTHGDVRLAAAERILRDTGFGRVAISDITAYVESCRKRQDRALNEARLALEREKQQLDEIKSQQDTNAKQQAEINLQQERRRRTQKGFAFALGLAALVLALGIGLVALQARHFAETRGRLTAEAAYSREMFGHFDSSLRLALLALQKSDEPPFAVVMRDARRPIGIWFGDEAVPLDANHFAEIALANSLQQTPQLFALVHDQGVRSAAFSPDGRRVVTASWDKTARIWDAATGKQVGEPLHHEDTVISAAFSPDGTRVVTASLDKTARIWDAATGKQVGELLRHEDAVESAAFSPDGRWVVTASLDKTARIWNAATGKQVGEPLRHERAVWSVAFSPDGTRVVTASWDETARIWDAATGKQVGEPLRHEEAVISATFSPDGTRVVTASLDKTARLWDAATGKQAGELLRHEGGVWSAAFSPDGRRVVTASGDKTARIWDAATGKKVGEPLRHEDAVFSVAFSPDGTRVVTASWDNTARIGDAATGKQVGEPLRHEASVKSATFSLDGTRVVTASLDKTARIWDAATGKQVGEPLRHEDDIFSAAFSPDGRQVVTASFDNTARLWDAATGKPLGEPLRHEASVNSAAFSPDGRRVVTASRDKTARIWDAATGKQVGEPLRHVASVNSAVFSPDGRRVVTASRDKTARIWDAATGKQVGEPLRHEDIVHSAAFSPNGSRVVTSSRNKTARLWDAATDKPLGEPLRHESAVYSAAFSPDGRRVVTASWDKTTRLWDAATGKSVGEPLRHEDAVISVAFSPDGTRVVTASLDKTARIWDAATGKQVGEPLRHEDAVWSAAFSPDGTRVVTASLDNTARLWDVRRAVSLKLDELVRLACTHYLGGSARPTGEELRLVSMEDEPVSDLCDGHAAAKPSQDHQ